MKWNEQLIKTYTHIKMDIFGFANVWIKPHVMCLLYCNFILSQLYIQIWYITIYGKLQSWSLSFTSYLNLIPNLSVVSIWSLTALVSCQFNLYRYSLDGKSWCVKWNKKKKNNYATSIANYTARSIKKTKQIKICTHEISFGETNRF